MKKILLTLLLAGGATSFTFAGGFQLNLQGVRQLAMGGTGVAHAWDASSIFYNPANISNLSGIQIYGSIMPVNPAIRYNQYPTGGYSYNSKNQWFTPFNVYIGGPIKKDSRLGIGLGVNTPFGSGTKWPDEWEGRYLSREIYLQSVYIQPTISYRINDIVSIGGGFVFGLGKVKLRQALPVQFADGSDGEAKLNGNAHGFGYNLGLQVKPIDNLEIGVNFRSRVTMKAKHGSAKFNVPSSLDQAFPNTRFKADLPLPSTLTFGVAYNPINNLILQADVEFVSWKAYDTLAFDYEQNTPQLQDTKAPRLYKSKAAFRLGAHYMFGKKIEGMIGGAYDPTPVRDGYVSPELPDANRLIGTVGIGYNPITKVSILVSAEFVTSTKRHGTYLPGGFDGRYQNKAFTLGIGATYDF